MHYRCAFIQSPFLTYSDISHVAQRSSYFKWQTVGTFFFFYKCKCYKKKNELHLNSEICSDSPNILSCLLRWEWTDFVHMGDFPLSILLLTHIHTHTNVHKHLSLWVELKDGDRWSRRIGSEERHREQAAEWWMRRTRERFTTGRISEPSVSVTAVRKWGAWPHISLSSEGTMGNGLQARAPTLSLGLHAPSLFLCLPAASGLEHEVGADVRD